MGIHLGTIGLSREEREEREKREEREEGEEGREGRRNRGNQALKNYDLAERTKVFPKNMWFR